MNIANNRQTDDQITTTTKTDTDTDENNVLAFPVQEKPKEPEYLNDAILLGVETPAFEDFLSKPVTFLTGEMWGTKDRRNTQDKDWKTNTMPWGAWISGSDAKGKAPAWGLSRHPEEKHKAGTSIVLGSSIGGARKANAMDEMYALGLDIDSGAKLDDVITKIEELDLFTLIYTSHSHGKIGMDIQRDELLRKLKIGRDPTLLEVQEFLRTHSKSRYEESFIEKIKIEEQKRQTAEGVKIVLSTPPLDKFRIIFPLAEPVKLIDLAPTQGAALDIWADKITGMAWEKLGIHFDTSCTDPSRLFYGPRHAKGAEWDSIIVRGDPLKFKDVPEYKKSEYTRLRDSKKTTERQYTQGGFDLNSWYSGNAEQFQFADFLETHCPDRIRGNAGQGLVTIECPFESYHSKEGGTGTIATDALDAHGGRGTISCRHDSCQGRKNAEYISEMLDQGWFTEDDLFDEDGAHLMEPGEVVDTADTGQKAASAASLPPLSDFEPMKDWLPSNYKRMGGMMRLNPTQGEIATWKDKFAQAKEDGKEEPRPPEPVNICGAFDVVGRSSNEDGTEGAGRIISFEGENEKRVEVTLSLAEIRSDPKAVFDVLSDRGLWLPVSKNAKINLQSLLNSITPKRQIPTVLTPGWTRDEHGEIAGFMLPTGEFITNDATQQMRLTEGSRFEVAVPRGSVDVFTKAAVKSFEFTETNFYWPLGLLAGFAGPLLGILKERSCGLAFSGHSSLGKSMALELGAAVMGSPEEGDGAFHSAKTTTNAIEDLCAMTTHGTFMFDEIGAFEDKRHLESVLFGIAGGVSKARKKDRNIGLAQRIKYNPFLLITSEFPLKQEIESGGGKYRDGLVARFPDICVSDDGVTVGEDVLRVLRAVNQNYGHAGPMFVRHLINTGIAFDRAVLADDVDKIIGDLAKGAPPVLIRAAKPFAIVMRAGQIAADAGMLGDREVAYIKIKATVEKAWSVFSESDSAGVASGGDAMLSKIRSAIYARMDRTIIAGGWMSKNEKTGEEVAHGEAAGADAKGTPIGWYDDEHIHLDWTALEHLKKALDLDIQRSDFVRGLGAAVLRKSEREAPQTRLPAHIAKMAGGTGISLKNLKISRSALEI